MNKIITNIYAEFSTILFLAVINEGQKDDLLHSGNIKDKKGNLLAPILYSYDDLCQIVYN
jgi:hypothetical protein